MQVIETVAVDSETRGMFEDSVRLYDLARKHQNVVDLLNKLLAQVRTLTKSKKGTVENVDKK